MKRQKKKKKLSICSKFHTESMCACIHMRTQKGFWPQTQKFCLHPMLYSLWQTWSSPQGSVYIKICCELIKGYEVERVRAWVWNRGSKLRFDTKLNIHQLCGTLGKNGKGSSNLHRLCSHPLEFSGDWSQDTLGYQNLRMLNSLI